MAAPNKDTIYIDIDDEITGIIEKLRGSDGKVVALVLPKRAAVFQSIVNMKLLKRAADSDKKHLVLITSEAGLLPLAGAAGVHVAKTLTSKPEIPLAPDAFNNDEEETISEDGEATDPELDKAAPVGALAGAQAADGVETIMLDDDDVPPELDSKPDGPKTFAPPKAKKDKKFKIPDFNRFRLMLVAGALLLVLLIIGIVWATMGSKATITIKTDATALDTNLNMNLSTTATKLNMANNTVPAKLAQVQKTFTQQVPTTGQKNNGNKASGDVRITNCSKTEGPITIPGGTGFSSGGNTYISQQSVTLPESTFTGGGKCTNNSKEDVTVIAQSGGASFNKPAGATFAIAGGQSGLSAEGGTMAGGTDSIVQTVNQNDINNAKAKISANDDVPKKELTAQLKDEGYYVINATFAPGNPNTTTSAEVGAVANNVTVTETITYTMFGAKRDDIKALIENSIEDQIDTEKQAVLDDGLDKANFNADSLSATAAQLTVTTTVTAGPDLDVDSIREQAAGKKAGPVKDELKTNPDVTDVQIKVSPFWVSSIPSKTDKITVNIAKPTNQSGKPDASDQ